MMIFLLSYFCLKLLLFKIVKNNKSNFLFLITNFKFIEYEKT